MKLTRKKLMEMAGLAESNIPFPTWYKSFVTKLATELQVEDSDLQFEMVDPHLMGIDAMIFSQEGLDNFPKDAKRVLKQPEFAGKAMMVWDNTGKIEDRLVAKYPQLEDHIYNDEYFWIFIK